MKIEKLSRVRNNYKVYLDDLVLIVTEDTLINHNLFKGKTVDEDLLEIIKEDDRLQKAYDQAFKYALKNKTQKEISNYLRRKELDEIQIYKVIERLKELKLIDDAKIVSMYANKKESLRQVKYRLRVKGVNSEVINENLDEFNELENLKLVYEKNKNRYNKFVDSDLRLIKYLLSKGYTYENIKRVMKKGV